jgi:2-haloacid dehalogenase
MGGERMEVPAAFVFDAYGTLFDVHSVAAAGESLAPGRGDELARLWRAKQLEYTWLTSLMATARRPRPDFDGVTAQALDYACAALRVKLSREAKRSLCGAWLTLAPYPDARDALAALVPRPRWILSNGTLASLLPLVRASGLEPLLSGVLSVDAADVYKPSPRVYALATEKLGLPARDIAFVSANCWDAVGAQAFGFTACWINRAGAPVDRHGPRPRYVLKSLAELPALA